MTEELQREIEYLHGNQHGKEWSGELITTEEGNLNNPSEWIITAHNIFLCDIGTSVYTDYEVGENHWQSEDVMQMYEEFPGLLEGTHKNQHCHTHHNMGAFFSGTDWEQMEDRSATCNYLLMLIVNVDGKYCAKVGMRVKRNTTDEVELSLVNNSDGYGNLRIKCQPEKEVLLIMDCEIEIQGKSVMPERFVNRYKAVNVAKPIKTATTTQYQSYNALSKEVNKHNTAVQGRIEYAEDDYNDWSGMNNAKGYAEDTYYGEDYFPLKKSKGIMDMTDEEWKEHMKEEEAPKIYRKNDVNIIINNILDGSISVNTRDCISRIKDLHKNNEKKDVFLGRLETELEEYFDAVCAGGDANDYLNMLQAIRTAFMSNKGNRIFADAIKIVEQEIGIVRNLVM